MLIPEVNQEEVDLIPEINISLFENLYPQEGPVLLGNEHLQENMTEAHHKDKETTGVDLQDHQDMQRRKNIWNGVGVGVHLFQEVKGKNEGPGLRIGKGFPFIFIF